MNGKSQSSRALYISVRTPTVEQFATLDLSVDVFVEIGTPMYPLNADLLSTQDDSFCLVVA